MPKETKVLKTFSKGLITAWDARDIDEESIALADGLSFSHTGKIQLLGDGHEDLFDISEFNPFDEEFLTFDTENETISTFRYDYDLGVGNGMSDEVPYTEFNSINSLSGWGAPPMLREGGCTYYIVTSGEDRNQMTLLCNFVKNDGTAVWMSVPYNGGTYNSEYNSDAVPSQYTNISSYPLYHYNDKIPQKMKVGPDSNAQISGYFVDGGYRYCDSNFENENNNIVGYFGHIKRTYCSELTNLRDANPVDTDNYEDRSFKRNSWHWNNYVAAHWDSDHSSDKYKRDRFTFGFPSWTGGTWNLNTDGSGNWNKPNQNFPNYKAWFHVSPNRDRRLKAGANIDADTEFIYAGDDSGSNSVLAFANTLEDNHPLRRRWIFAMSTLYDGDPEIICQETSLSYIQSPVGNYSPTNDTMLTRYMKPWILDLKNKASEENPNDSASSNEWDYDANSAGANKLKDSSAVTFKVADFQENPKLYFTWTYFPWWADGAHTIDYQNDDADNTPVQRLSTAKPTYDCRTTGWRVYMRDLDDEEENWYCLATIDALRGRITYNGCDVQVENWLPRGSSSLKRYRKDGSKDNENYLPNGQTYPDMLVENIPLTWSNHTSGRSQIDPGNGADEEGNEVNLIRRDEARWGGVTDIDPGYHNQSGSVNITSIPELTYEMINGFKPDYSPTAKIWYGHPELLSEGYLVSESNWQYGDTDTKEVFSPVQRPSADVWRWKDSLILNDRVFIANLKSCKTGEEYPDMILKSEPGMYDIFPNDGFHHINVASGDGDSIVSIETLNGKIFVFKNNTLYIIKINEDGSESIEATHQHYGIRKKSHVIHTKHGLCWFNESGLYLYIKNDGKIVNLIEMKLDSGKYIEDFINIPDVIDTPGVDFLEIDSEMRYLLLVPDYRKLLTSYLLPENLDLLSFVNNTDYDWEEITANLYPTFNFATDGIDNAHFTMSQSYFHQIQFGWLGFIGSDGGGGKPNPSIGYDEKHDQLIIFKSTSDSGQNRASGDCYVYDFKTQTFAFEKQGFPSGHNSFKSNFVNDAKGNLVYIASVDNNTTMKKWSNKPTEKKKNILLMTPDMDFDSPGVRKKIHKVYVSFKSEGASHVNLLYAVNGSKNFRKANRFKPGRNYADDGFQFSADESINYSHETQWKTAILEPDVSTYGGDALNNIYSIQLLFVGNQYISPNENGEVQGQDVQGVDVKFEINDISVIYRMKSAK